ncbi:hypothetical protein B0H11DRAFT_2427625 [Mycena galericulata]|nr:hypothetical protein B0H11DRAFT_2427625 [Mycena galericulata]
MDLLDIDSDDELRSSLDRKWEPQEWISRGKKYEDVPPFVEVALCNLLRIPSSFTNKLPPKTMPISQLLQYDLPPRSNAAMDITDTEFDFFTALEPARDIQDVLLFLALPTRTMLKTMLQKCGQAWFDGNTSMRTWLIPEIALPFWVLTYWDEMLNACESQACWLRAEAWINRTEKTAEEATMKLTIRGLWNVLPWHGNLGSIPVAHLAALFSTNYLGSDIVDALIALLSLRLRLSQDTISQNSLIVDSTFASMVRMLLPVVDGVALGPINTSQTGRDYLDKHRVWSMDKDHQYLHLVLYRPPKHWTACRLDFKNHQIQYGDGLHWSRPQEFFDALECWLRQRDATEFIVTDDHGYNCPLIAVNTIAHNALGDPLWTPKNARAMRMKAFCDIVKYTLSITNQVKSVRDTLAPFVTLRREHQTREERMGVRTYRGSNTYINPNTGAIKELSDRQRLAQAMQAIVKRDHQQGSSTGLNRSTRWKTETSALPPAKTGNAANAEVTAGSRAKESNGVEQSSVN